MENIFIYEISDDYLVSIRGIVKASNKQDAELKVREAYLKHEDDFDKNTTINILEKESGNFWFQDCPDVLEVSF